MPNWCTTDITINCENIEELKRFDSLLEKWMETEYIENGFGESWLGNIVGNSGIGTVDEDKETDLRCRGQVIYKELNGNQLLITTETAWVPMLKMWSKLIKRYLSHAELIYTAEECGNGIWCTNDEVRRYMYMIDNYNSQYDINSCYDADEKETITALQEILQTEEDNIDTLMELFNQRNIDGINIVSWEYVDIDEWD